MQSTSPAMSYIRRALGVVLGAIFLLSLLATLAFVRLNATLLEPRFYPDLVQSSDVYRFVMVDALASAIDETRRVDTDRFAGIVRENPIVASGLTTSQIVEAVHRGLPPSDLERLASPILLQVGQYLRGDRDTLVVNLEADLVRRVTWEIHGLMRESGAYDSLIERELEPRVRDAAAEMLGSDENVSVWMEYLFGDAVDAEDWVVRVVMSSLTADWLAGQVEQALDEFTAYLVGETDAFEIRVRLTGTDVDRAVEETKSILREVDAYELIYTGVVEPALTDVLRPVIRLPDGATATREEVIDALRQAAPPSWVQQEAEALIDNVGPYVVGRSDSFSTEIDLSDNKREAATALGESALAPIPDTVTFNQGYLRSVLEQSGGSEALERLDYIRTVMDDGWIYSHHDLRADLSEGGDAVSALDNARAFLSDGYSHTHGDVPMNRLERTLHNGQKQLDTARRLQWIAYLLTPFLLVAVGLLGANGWRGRIVWMSVTLLVSALSIFLLSWPMEDALTDTVIEQSGIDVSGQSGGLFESTSRLLSDKWVEVVEAFSEEFVGGIRLHSLILAGAAALVLLTAAFWPRAVALVERAQGRPNLPTSGGVR